MEKPSLPKGTRDFGPAQMARRQFILDHIRNVFRKYGFQPLETPAMENLSTLTGKYGEEGDQLLFRILNSGDFLKDVDPGALASRDSRSLSPRIAEKGLRYDLTVPFARYVVMNRNEIPFPFKRYQIQPVWRADRPQKGRYREFYQCDADVVGTASLLCEAEIILMIKEVFRELGITDFSIRINHRGILNGVSEIIGAAGRETSLFVAIDKLDKLGWEQVKHELRLKDFSEESLEKLSGILGVKGSNTNKLSFLASIFETAESGQRGLRDLKEVLDLLSHYGADEANVEIDPTLARGLSYYTGCIFEVNINNVRIGSVSGGGRYDNLTQAFGDRDNLSGVGFSFGVDRLYDAMDELRAFPASSQVSSRVLVCHLDDASMKFGFKALASLRKAGIASEIFPDLARIKKQLDFANRKMIPYAIVIGSDEVASGLLSFKNMETGESEKLKVEDIIKKISSVN